MEQNKQYKSAFRSADSPVAPLGHLVVDRHLKEMVRLHVGSYFLQSLKTAHESLQIRKFIQALGLKHTVLIYDIIGEEIYKGELFPSKP